jgi:DNA-binding MarR family transcriptional regulator
MGRRKAELNYSNIFESVEFPDAYKVSYLANAIVFPTYEDIRKDFGLVRAEYHLLLCLAHYSELTAQDVARITRRPRNSISRAVHRMLDLGFLRRVPDPSDARQAKLQITKEGKIMHNKISKYLVAREAEIFNVLSESERKHFTGLIRKLANFASTLKR